MSAMASQITGISIVYSTVCSDTDQWLEQLECLCSENTLRCSMITHIHIRSQVKTKQSQSYKFKNIDKTSNVRTFQKALHATYRLKLLNKMYTYEMDPANIVEVTERTGICPQTDGQTDERASWNQYAPFQLR